VREGRLPKEMSEIEVKAEMMASVWKLRIAPGDVVSEGQELLILESMKMEIPLNAPEEGEVLRVNAEEGEAVRQGAVLVVIRTSP